MEGSKEGRKRRKRRGETKGVNRRKEERKRRKRTEETKVVNRKEGRKATKEAKGGNEGCE